MESRPNLRFLFYLIYPILISGQLHTVVKILGRPDETGQFPSHPPQPAPLPTERSIVYSQIGVDIKPHPSLSSQDQIPH
ncbi:hypothetical protein CMK14_17575 [Candidatus Poribacteria bacterium]|nr:hypothetical protein [Candidatus Poribacteria bacterium]